ncbi:regulatory particle non-ATPase [Lobaria immixta]|nr:regulatory particle non-ATPase [Lobaria immixta]
MSVSTSTLTSLLSQLNSNPPPPPDKIASLLSSAKRTLLTLNALLPTPSTSPHLLTLARQVLETGALLSIRLHQPDAFTRYFQQLLPFYELPPSSFSGRENGGDAMEIETGRSGKNQSEDRGQRSKITGLYLLLLLTKGDYAGFHTVLEGLEVEGSVGAEEDVYVQYPIKLERWLMEGSYDRVWGATKREGVPSEEFGVFSEVLIGTIRSEIASCSEKAYPSLPIANAKNLLFLDSEGSVVEFARERRGWLVRDGRIYFPSQQGLEVGEEGGLRSEKEILVASGQVIENTIGYARELETIV